MGHQFISIILSSLRDFYALVVKRLCVRNLKKFKCNNKVCKTKIAVKMIKANLTSINFKPRRGGIIIENVWIIIRNPEGVKL
jgi:hypothetical protein